MERTDEKGLGMHGNGNTPAIIGMHETKMTPSLVNYRKTQLAQGFDNIFRIYFFARHYTGTATRAVVIKSVTGCSTGNDCFSFRRHSR